MEFIFIINIFLYGYSTVSYTGKDSIYAIGWMFKMKKKVNGKTYLFDLWEGVMVVIDFRLR